MLLHVFYYLNLLVSIPQYPHQSSNTHHVLPSECLSLSSPLQGPQWRRALDVILQWCFSHNFSVRLYALLALKRVWGLAAARAEAERAGDGLGGLAAVVEACLSQAEAMQSTG